MDAFEYAKKCMTNGNFDYAFMDLWHDASDGVELYLKMKKLKRFSPDRKYLYWIENSLLFLIYYANDLRNNAPIPPMTVF